MPSFNQIIDLVKGDCIDPDQSIAIIKSNHYIKHISKYLVGGTSSLKKSEIQHLINTLNSYESDKYIFNGRRIYPDKEQQQIIEAPLNSNIRVIAGAGTGKTTTILCRVKRLLDISTTPDRILILTFNVDAKDNLIKNAKNMFGINIKLDIRTIDSFCGKIRYDFSSNSTSGKHFSKSSNLTAQSENCLSGLAIMKKYGSTISSQYQYVFFDEFQDVNREQFDILKIFSKNGCYLTVIGDDSQNIYEFRGTNNYWIINFDTLIPNTLTYKITSNYRSTPGIVTLANEVVAHNKIKIAKTMTSNAKNNIDDGVIDLNICKTTGGLQTLIVQKILQYIENGIEHHDIAILSRNGKPLKSIETELEKHQIPYIAMINDKNYGDSSKASVLEGSVTLTTIHKAKGLEWHAVFIVGLADDHFPTHMNNGLSHIEEERRLFYVAVTRAKVHLHFVAVERDLPVSRFIKEISPHVTIRSTSNLSEDKIFDRGISNSSDSKSEYDIVNLLSHLSGKSIKSMRKRGIIPDVTPETDQIFDQKLDYSDQIKKGRFEPDYAIYLRLYMMRKLMIKNKQILEDISAKQITGTVFMTDVDRALYNEYDLRNYFINNLKKVTKKIDDVNKLKVESLITRIKKVIKARNIQDKDIDLFLLTQLSTEYYPDWLLNTLDTSYKNYADTDNLTKTIKRDMYYVSLCTQFKLGRKRLAHRDIWNLYKESDKLVLPRINQYLKHIKGSNQISRINTSQMYDIKGEQILLAGEIDYIDTTNQTIVSIRCSNHDFQMEWLVQLLANYAIYTNQNTGKNAISIKNLGVINIFDGVFYEFRIPDNYDHTRIIDYLETVLTANLEGVRENGIGKGTGDDSADSELDEMDVDEILHDDALESELFKESRKANKSISVDLSEVSKPGQDMIKKYMVLDLENNMGNGDIIQIAYCVYDYMDTVIKSVNSYIKDRYVDTMTQEKTGIGIDKLRKFGKPFEDVAIELLKDLASVQYICGHNVSTDIAKINNNLYKFGIIPSINVFDCMLMMDTMKIFKQHSGKAVTVSKMVLDLFDEPMIGAHDAMADVTYTARCYVEMKDRIQTDTDDLDGQGDQGDDLFVKEYGEKIESIMMSATKVNKSNPGSGSAELAENVSKSKNKKVKKNNSDEKSTESVKSSKVKKSKNIAKVTKVPKYVNPKIDEVIQSRNQTVKKKNVVRMSLSSMTNMGKPKN
jgi:DNA polymerase III epsilon subunit-like protein